MTRTFLVACDIDPNTDVDSFAAEILDSLTLDGIPATSCKPWASAMTDQSPPETGFIPPWESGLSLG